MGAELPKQYLKLAGRPVIEHTLERLGTHPRISGMAVAVAEGDTWWDDLRLDMEPSPARVPGGKERCHSVLNGLAGLEGQAAADDWVLVHDAARPCIRQSDITLLIDALSEHAVGGVLGLPVRDTMKRTDVSGEILKTVSREGLWHALTPQMFRFRTLSQALELVVSSGQLVTDEAQAMELAGFSPRMVEGQADNIKITRPRDMVLAELYLQQQEAEFKSKGNKS